MLLTLLVWVVVACFLIWGIYAVVNAFGTPEPWRTLLFVVVGVILLLYLVLPALQGHAPPLLR
jgi:hypothetical protein